MPINRSLKIKWVSRIINQVAFQITLRKIQYIIYKQKFYKHIHIYNNIIYDFYFFKRFLLYFVYISMYMIGTEGGLVLKKYYKVQKKSYGERLAKKIFKYIHFSIYRNLILLLLLFVGTYGLNTFLFK